MTPRRFRRATATLAAGLILSLLDHDQAAAADLAALGPQFRDVIERTLRQCQVPGALVGVFSGNRSWTAAFGLADVARGRPVRRHDRFAIRSVTKSFVATEVLRLVAQGRVGLDDPIARYYRGVPDGDRITLRDLAGMTSGLFDYVKDGAFVAQLGADPLHRWTDSELIAFALAHPVRFRPGAEYEYSNTNTLLLGQVIARVTGRRVGPALEGGILGPLGLDGTLYLYGSRTPAPRALGYQGFTDGRLDETEISFTGLGASGAMVSTLDDLKRWGEVLVEGALLPERLQRQRFAARKATNGPEYDRYGLGMGEIDGWWGHTGSGAGFEAAVFRTPGRRDDTIVILLDASNFQNVQAGLLRRLISILETGSEGGYRGRAVCG
jgi:D-alanyl-D-alanine carboxypeptidase